MTRSTRQPTDDALSHGAPNPHASDEPIDLVLRLTPWGVSFLLHAGLILLAVFVIWSVRIEQERQETFVPNVIDNRPVLPTRTIPTPRTTDTLRKSERQRVVRPTSTPDQIVGIPKTASDDTKLLGPTMSDSRKTSPFGPRVVDRPEMNVIFYVPAQGDKIVYLVDASGSLIESLPFVIDELGRSINALSAKQSFTVIFFQGGDVLELPPRGLQAATDDYKRKAVQWVDLASGNIIPGGLTNPVNALERGLMYKPELIYLLSDNITGSGIYQVDQKTLLGRIDQANRAMTRICTIQFLTPDPLVASGLPATMQLIADRTGGAYKYLNAGELDLE